MVLTALFMALAMGGCKWGSAYDYSPYYNRVVEETVYLFPENDSSPFCDFAMDYSCLSDEQDSIIQTINQTLQQEFLGHAYRQLSPDAAIDSFMNDYLREFRKEVGEMYQMDLASDSTGTEIPAWYNRTYSMITFLDDGMEGIKHASANYFVDLGGAHPSQWSKWINFDIHTGKLLGKDDVFMPEAKAEIEALLLDKLILLQAKNYPDETINTLEDLQNKGFLSMTNMYIPDNFLLNKDKVMFLFNRYDIAPYAAGETILEVAYEEMNHYMKIK